MCLRHMTHELNKPEHHLKKLILFTKVILLNALMYKDTI